jgi:TonB family protein
MIRRVWRSATWSIVAFLAAPMAHADLYAAEAAYQKKDFTRAFELFRELAELGQPMAQETLAIMYVQGEGVPRSNVLGYAWAMLTKENGLATNVQPIIDQIGPRLTPEGRKTVDELHAQFGKEALEKRLLPLPIALATDNKPERPVCRMTRPANPDTYYPPQAAAERVSGSVIIRTTVLPDGHARNPRVTFSVPPNAFDAAGRNVALHTGFEAPKVNGVAVPCSITFRVRFTLINEGAPPHLVQQLEKLKVSAEAGDPLSQFQYAALMTGWYELNPQQLDMTPMFIKAAQAGISSAQFFVGRSQVLRSEAGEYQKGLLWLNMAANAGQQDAQIELAAELLRRGGGEEDRVRARDLLNRAVSAGSTDAGYYLADMLIGDSDPTLREPQRALDLVNDVYAYKNDDPTTLEIRAAAFSQLGKFTDAARVQHNALNKAKSLGWDTAPQMQRLEMYRRQEAWTQRLLIY